MNDKIIELAKKYSLYGWPLISILISVIIAFSVIFPQIFKYFQTQKDIAALDQRRQALETKASSLAAINTENYQANLEIVKTVLPESEDLPASIGQIEALLSQANLELQDITFASGQSGLAAGVTATNKNVVGLQNFQIKLDVTGSRSALQAFMQDVQDAPQVMRITGLDISNGTSGNVSATLTLVSYYEGPPGNISNVEQPLAGLTAAENDLLSKLQQQVATSPVNTGVTVLPKRGKDNPFQ